MYSWLPQLERKIGCCDAAREGVGRAGQDIFFESQTQTSKPYTLLCTTLQPQTSASIPKPQTLQSQALTKPQTPHPQTPDPKPQPPNSKPQTLKPQTLKPQTPNSKSQTSNPIPQISNPKPQTPNPTLYPKSYVPNPHLGPAELLNREDHSARNGSAKSFGNLPVTGANSTNHI